MAVFCSWVPGWSWPCAPTSTPKTVPAVHGRQQRCGGGPFLEPPPLPGCDGAGTGTPGGEGPRLSPPLHLHLWASWPLAEGKVGDTLKEPGQRELTRLQDVRGEGQGHPGHGLGDRDARKLPVDNKTKMSQGGGSGWREDLPVPEGSAGVGRLAHRAQRARPGLGLATGGADANTHTQAATVCTFIQETGTQPGSCISYKYRVLSTKYR